MWTTVVLVITLTAGTAMIMWLGELLTEKGIGNGMSVLIFTSIAARIPAEGGSILQTRGALVFAVVCAFALVVIGSVVYVEQAQRRIPVQYAKRMVGRRMYGGTSTYLPLKVNQAGVIPVIFASSLLYLPQLITQLQGNSTGSVRRFFENYVIDQSSPVHVALYFGLIVFFTYFYVSITFNPEERADDMKRYGGFIPGIRPGRPTAEYLQYVLSRITLPGSIYLGLVAVLPNLFLSHHAAGAEPELPVRRYRGAHHGRSGVGDGEADRDATQPAQLRRVPEVVRVVLLGPPGAGKGTQAQIIAERLGVPAISTGDIFRANVSGQTELGQQAKTYMDAGDLVPDEITVAMVKDRLAEPDAKAGFLLDGFPRTISQAEQLRSSLADLGQELRRRARARRRRGGAGPPALRRAGMLVDGQMVQRDDDKPETVRHRLEVYREQTAPLSGFYESEGLLSRIDAIGEVEEVTARALEALGVDDPGQPSTD